jgi:hypothetical protein
MAIASFRDKGVRRLGEPGEMALDPGWRVASPRWRSGGFLERHCGRQPADHLPLRSRDEPSMSISSTTTNGATGGVGPMRQPPHPGEIMREEVIRPLGLSVTAAAAALGVTRQAIRPGRRP